MEDTVVANRAVCLQRRETELGEERQEEEERGEKRREHEVCSWKRQRGVEA